MNATTNNVTRTNDNTVNMFESSFNHYFQRNEGISRSARLLKPIDLDVRPPLIEMNQRWIAKLQAKVPQMDMVDLLAQRDPAIKMTRQATPEIAYEVYKNTLEKECAIGDYINVVANSVRITEEVRLYMITVIIEVHRIKKYKEETLYLACNLADRYLALLTILQRPSPCLIRLAFVCILMAAKLEEPIQPSFNRMVRLVASEWNFETTKEEIVEMESQVIRTLDWDLHMLGPIFFLERYQRIFGVENEKSDPDAARVGGLARKILRCLILSSNYLKYKPSQMAAAALMLSININGSPCAQLMGANSTLYFLKERGHYYKPPGQQMKYCGSNGVMIQN